MSFLKRNQKGVSFVETAITLPVLILLLTGLLEIAKLINSHILASHLAYESVRLASKTPALIDYFPSGDEVNINAQIKLRDKIKILASKHDVTLNDSNIGIEIENPHSTEPERQITLTISLPYVPIIRLFNKEFVISDSTTEYIFEKK